MKTIFASAAIISGLLLLGTSSFAQEYASPQVIQKIRADVSSIQSGNTAFNEAEQYGLSQMNRDLDVLRVDRMYGKDYDQAFDQVVFTLQSLVNDSRLTHRDHEIMQENLNLLRGTTFADTQAFAK